MKRLKRPCEGDRVVVWAQRDRVKDVCEVVLVVVEEVEDWLQLLCAAVLVFKVQPKQQEPPYTAKVLA